MIKLTVAEQRLLDLVWAGDNSHLPNEYHLRFVFAKEEAGSDHAIYDAHIRESTIQKLVQRGLIKQQPAKRTYGRYVLVATEQAEGLVTLAAQEAYKKAVAYRDCLAKAKAIFAEMCSPLVINFSLLGSDVTFPYKYYRYGSCDTCVIDGGELHAKLMLNYADLRVAIIVGSVTPYQADVLKSNADIFAASVSGLILKADQINFRIHYALFGNDPNPYIKKQKEKSDA